MSELAFTSRIDQLWQRFLTHDRMALSRLLTMLARGQGVDQLTGLLDESDGDEAGPRVVAFTGSGGVGKSTLVGKSIEYLRGQGDTVAVLACDPESTLTGGALLGDRVRMTPEDDDGVLVRSLAAPAGHQAIAEHLDLMTRLLARYGFNRLLIETVGAGQGDVAVRRWASVLVLLVQPEAGDDLQWEKAGLLEVADVVVVNKADLPGAERVEAQLREMLNLPGCRQVPVLRVTAAKAQGLAELWSAIDALPDDTADRS
ncbi:MAG: GTP-binding protein [Pirellulaceae bacterium]